MKLNKIKQEENVAKKESKDLLDLIYLADGTGTELKSGHKRYDDQQAEINSALAHLTSRPKHDFFQHYNFDLFKQFPEIIKDRQIQFYTSDERQQHLNKKNHTNTIKFMQKMSKNDTFYDYSDFYDEKVVPKELFEYLSTVEMQSENNLKGVKVDIDKFNKA